MAQTGIFEEYIIKDLLASRPAATAVTPGTLYGDENGVVYRSDGTTWETYTDPGTGGGGGGTIGGSLAATQVPYGSGSNTVAGNANFIYGSAGRLENTVPSGNTSAILGLADTGIGVDGQATGASGVGLSGYSGGASGIGVVAELGDVSGTGVEVRGPASMTGKLFRGLVNSVEKWAVDAAGNLVTGVGRLVVSLAGSVVGTRRQINLIQGTNVTLTVADDAGNDRVNVTIAASGGGGYTDPLTTKGDIPAYSTSTVRFPVGTNGTYLQADSTQTTGLLWAPAPGFANPMTTSQDLIVGGSAGAAGRLGAGSNGQVLSVVAGAVAWAAATGFANPMTTQDDLIVGGASGAATRLAKGSDSQVLTVDPTSHHVAWATPAGGGSASTIYTNTYASPPGSPVNGDSWYPSDGVGVYFLRVSGAWVARFAGMPVSDPSLQTWAWINQTSGSVTGVVDGSRGSIILTAPKVAGDHQRIRKKAAPSTPYTVTMACLPLIYPSTFANMGLCFRESSSGKVIIFAFVWDTNLPSLAVQKFASPTAWSATYAAYNAHPWQNSPVLWLRIADNGTNRICSVSMDGVTFMPLHSVGRTDFLTADEVGFYANASQATADVALTVLSWQEA